MLVTGEWGERGGIVRRRKDRGERFLIKHELAEPVPPTLPTFPARTLSALFTFIGFPSPRTLFFSIYSAVYTYFLIFVPRLPSTRFETVLRPRPCYTERKTDASGNSVGIKQEAFCKRDGTAITELARIDRTGF